MKLQREIVKNITPTEVIFKRIENIQTLSEKEKKRKKYFV